MSPELPSLIEASDIFNQPDLPEALSAEPDAELRLHHFVSFCRDFNRGTSAHRSLWSAMRLMDDEEIERRITADVEILQTDAETPGESTYFHDIYPSAIPEEIEARLRDTVHGVKAIASLPDSAILKLSVRKHSPARFPDPVCNTCIVGEHCEALTLSKFRSDGRPVQTLIGEERSAEIIISWLGVYGHDAEWFSGHEQVALTDEHGRSVTVNAPYMLLTMGTARRLINGFAA